MSNRTVVRRPNRTLCLGDLKEQIILHTRDLTEPEYGEVDATEDFNPIKSVWAAIKTTSGKAFFAGVHGDVSVTHEISIRYRDDVSAETWIELKTGSLLDIVAVENLEERDEWLKLQCSERGSKALGSAQA